MDARPDSARSQRRGARRLARTHGLSRWSTDVDRALANPADTVFFDSASTQGRASLLNAPRAGKHVYCEKRVAPGLGAALELVRLARKCGVKHGVVQDKRFLPGLLKLAMLVKSGFFGRILSVRGDSAPGYSKAICSR